VRARNLERRGGYDICYNTNYSVITYTLTKSRQPPPWAVWHTPCQTVVSLLSSVAPHRSPRIYHNKALSLKRDQEVAKNIALRMPSVDLIKVHHCVVAPSCRPTPPPPRSSWWPAPPSTDPYGIEATNVPFPQLDRLPIDGALGPRHLSKRSLGPPVCRPRLGSMPQPGCTGGRVLITGPRGGGRGRRRRRRTPANLDRRRPCTRVIDPPDGEDHHWSTRPTQGPLAPRTTTPPALPTPSLAAPPPPVPPPIKADPSTSGTPLDLKSMCGNRVIRWLACFAAPTGKCRAPGSWDSTVGPSR
jgi:hypothetical protein